MNLVEVDISPSTSEQIRQFRDCYIEYPLIKAIYADFDRLRENQHLGGKQRGLLITGDSGSGKTQLVENYRKQFNDQIQQGFVNKLLLVTRVPAELSLKNIIAEMMADLGQFGSAQVCQKGSPLEMIQALVALLKQCKTELVIINKSHLLTDFNHKTMGFQILGYLRDLSEKTGIPIVFVGMPWASQILEHPDWKANIQANRELAYFKIVGKEGINLKDKQGVHVPFIALLKGFARRMPFETIPELGRAEFAMPLFAASNGCIDRIKELLDEGVKQALKSGSETLAREHLSSVYSLFHPTELNTFEIPLVELQISEVDEYSKINENALKPEDAIIPAQFTRRTPLSQLLVR